MMKKTANIKDRITIISVAELSKMLIDLWDDRRESIIGLTEEELNEMLLEYKEENGDE